MIIIAIVKKKKFLKLNYSLIIFKSNNAFTIAALVVKDMFLIR
jgi:hypothetical protein